VRQISFRSECLSLRLRTCSGVWNHAGLSAGANVSKNHATSIFRAEVAKMLLFEYEQEYNGTPEYGDNIFPKIHSLQQKTPSNVAFILCT
jgi:hypothetical protein